MSGLAVDDDRGHGCAGGARPARRSPRGAVGVRHRPSSSGSARPPGSRSAATTTPGALRPAVAGVPGRRPAGVVGDGGARRGRPPTPHSATGRTRSTRIVAGRRRAHGVGPVPRPADGGRGVLALGAAAVATAASRSSTSSAGSSPGCAVMAALELAAPAPRAGDPALVAEYGGHGRDGDGRLRRLLRRPAGRRGRRRGDAAARRAAAGAWRVWPVAEASSSSAPASAGSPSPSGSPRPATRVRCSSATRWSAASSTYGRGDGYTFDVGPSLLTLPTCSTSCSGVAGTTLAAEVDLVAPRPAVPVPLARRCDARRPRRPRRDRRRVRGVLARCRRGVAALRRPGPADLGRQRAHVPRRTDDGPRRPARAGCARRAT